MERASRLLLGLEALPASLFSRFGAIITVNKGFLNTNTVITWQLMRTARTLEAEWWQVLQGSVGTGTKEDESSTGRVWAAGYHHVTARCRFAGVLKLMNRFFLFSQYWYWISDTGARLFPFNWSLRFIAEVCLHRHTPCQLPRSRTRQKIHTVIRICNNQTLWILQVVHLGVSCDS